MPVGNKGWTLSWCNGQENVGHIHKIVYTVSVHVVFGVCVHV